MMNKVIATLALLAAVVYLGSASVILKGSSDGVVVVRATGNQSVPSVDYIVNAVETLKQSIEVFPDEANQAKLYAALFQTKYPANTWNVAVGYSTLYINSTIFIETQVSGGGKQLKDDKKKGNLYMIFSSK